MARAFSISALCLSVILLFGLILFICYAAGLMVITSILTIVVGLFMLVGIVSFAVGLFLLAGKLWRK